MDIGIMQGRLCVPEADFIQVFPIDNWRQEFPAARVAGLVSIEWIYDTYGLGANPLETGPGCAEIAKLASGHGIAVRSVCADYFMDNPLFGAAQPTIKERLARLSWLIEVVGKMGMERMVIPFVDASSIDGEAAETEVLSNLLEVSGLAERLNVEIHLETDLPPQPFARLMEKLSNPIFKVNYDSGNSAALGYQVADEFAAYGSHVGSVHIKDRELHGTTVKLGTGACDFPELFNQLDRVGYKGAFILQVARGAAGEEIELAIENRQFSEAFTKVEN